MFEWLIVFSFQFVIFSSVKNDTYKTFSDTEIDDARNR